MADSRAFITQKLVAGISSNIDSTEKILNTQKMKNLLSDSQIEIIQSEISVFRKNPTEYVSGMIMNPPITEVSPFDLTSEKPLNKVLLIMALSWKQNIKAHFDKTFAGLLFDIRLFLLSNVIGLFMAAFIARHNEKLGKHALVGSLILTGVIIFSSFTYINSNWFYNILLGRYTGIAYPVGVFIISLGLYVDYLKTQKKLDINLS
jgi:hypothetical protein